MTLPLTKENAARWRDDGPPLFNELIGYGNWQMDEGDYGFSVEVGFQRPDGKLAAVRLSYADRREQQYRDGPDDDRSFVLTVAEARQAIERALA